jgi:hypothetical protein
LSAPLLSLTFSSPTTANCALSQSTLRATFDWHDEPSLLDEQRLEQPSCFFEACFGQNDRLRLAERLVDEAYAATGDSFSADKARLWSAVQIGDPGTTCWNLDLALDGRFVMFPRPEAAREQKGSVHVTVLLNFFDA